MKEYLSILAPIPQVTQTQATSDASACALVRVLVANRRQVSLEVNGTRLCWNTGIPRQLTYSVGTNCSKWFKMLLSKNPLPCLFPLTIYQLIWMLRHHEGRVSTDYYIIYIYIDISIFTHYLQWFLQPLYGFQTKGFWLSPSDSLWPRPSLRALKSSQVAWVFGTSRTQSIPQGWGPDWPSQRRPGKNRSPALTSTSGFLRSHQKVS